MKYYFSSVPSKSKQEAVKFDPTLFTTLLAFLERYFPTVAARAKSIEASHQTLKGRSTSPPELADPQKLVDYCWSLAVAEFMIGNRSDRIFVDDFTNLIVLARESGLIEDKGKNQYLANNSNPADITYDKSHWGVSDNGTVLAAGYYQMHPITFETVLYRLGVRDYTKVAKESHKKVPGMPWYIQVLLVCVRNYGFYSQIKGNAVADRLMTSASANTIKIKNWFYSKLFYGYGPSFVNGTYWNTLVRAWGTRVSDTIEKRSSQAEKLYGVTDIKDLVIFGRQSPQFEKLTDVNVTQSVRNVVLSCLSFWNRAGSGTDPLSKSTNEAIEKLAFWGEAIEVENPPSFFSLKPTRQEGSSPSLPLYTKIIF